MWAARSRGRWRWKVSESHGYFQLAEHLDKISSHLQRKPFKSTLSPLRHRSLSSPVAQIRETEASFATHPRSSSISPQSHIALSQCPKEAGTCMAPWPLHGQWGRRLTALLVAGPCTVLGGAPNRSPTLGSLRATSNTTTSALRSGQEGAKGNLCCLLMMKHLSFPC